MAQNNRISAARAHVWVCVRVSVTRTECARKQTAPLVSAFTPCNQKDRRTRVRCPEILKRAGPHLEGNEDEGQGHGENKQNFGQEVDLLVQHSDLGVRLRCVHHTAKKNSEGTG